MPLKKVLTDRTAVTSQELKEGLVETVTCGLGVKGENGCGNREQRHFALKDQHKQAPGVGQN